MINLFLFFLLTSFSRLSASFIISSRNPASNVQIFATIFEWEDNSISSSSGSNPTYSFENETPNKIRNEDYTSMAETITQNKDKTASLARLAVAFSPPDQRFNIEDINHIHIIEVTNDHIEISAVICDEADCLTLLVPISFPHDCGGSSSNIGTTELIDAIEECVLDNIFELDVEAQEVLRQRHIEKHQEASDQQQELLNALYRSDDVQFPSWWIHPIGNDMVEECQKIKGILNQHGFQTQVKALTCNGLVYCDDGKMFEIHKAAVCAVGPAGFYFRAIATKKEEFVKNQLAEEYTILDIPHKIFSSGGSRPISDASELRAAVLGAVASVE